MASELNVSEQWRRWRERVDLDEYNTRWDRMEANGATVHDEAAFVCRFDGDRIIDAGCGMGRVGIELARRGKTVIGVDNDSEMLSLAKANSDAVTWVLADLATVQVPGSFHLVVMAGDVLNYVVPGCEPDVVANLAMHLSGGGRLVSGLSLAEPHRLDRYDTWCVSAGLIHEDRFATWVGQPYTEDSQYAVSVHRRPESA